MTNSDMFKAIFGLYATELWSMSEAGFLEWLNAESKTSTATDSISKQNVIDTIKDADVFVFCGGDTSVEDAIEIAIRSTKGSVITDIEQLPPVLPEQKTGKWIYNIDDIFPMDSQMECGNCHASYPIYLCNEFNFCPNCGAKMEE